MALAALGFYQAIGIPEPDDFGEWKGFVQIVSGSGPADDNPEKLAGVADLATQTWGDQAFADRVHGALNEALTNVIMHAYDPDLLDQAEPCEAGRWWVAGFALDGEAWFLALDHGVGIPSSAPAKNKGVKAYLAEFERVSDADVIHAVVAEEGRSRTGLPNHGKGIPAMLALIDEKAESGAVLIFSGNGGFILDKRLAAGPLPSRNLSLKVKLQEKLSGTLIIWKVGRPIVTATPETGA